MKVKLIPKEYNILRVQIAAQLVANGEKDLSVAAVRANCLLEECNIGVELPGTTSGQWISALDAGQLEACARKAVFAYGGQNSDRAIELLAMALGLDEIGSQTPAPRKVQK